jgi:chitodextrinase
LTATNSVGSTTASATVTVTTTVDTTAPTTPTGLTGSVLSSSSVRISWNASTDNVGVAGYKVYRNGALRTSLNALTYQDSGLSANTTYSYNVAAYDAAGNTSALSASISLTTASVSLPVIGSFAANPTSITAGGSSTLSWSVTGATTLSISPVVGIVTGLTQKLVTPLTTTTYVLTATNSGGSTTASATVTVTTTQDTAAPTTPTGLTGSVLSPSSVKISWNASIDNVGVTGYKVYRNGVLRASVNALTYQDNGLIANTTYSYRVAAYDAAGNTSALSAPISLTPLVQGPWTGEYFTLLPSMRFHALIFTRTDAAINFNWGAGSPGTGVPADDFGVRWTASLAVPQSRAYNFTVTSNDGVRMWIDGVLVLDKWQNQSATFTFSASLTAGIHSFQVEYYDDTGNANVSVSWK